MGVLTEGSVGQDGPKALPKMQSFEVDDPRRSISRISHRFSSSLPRGRSSGHLVGASFKTQYVEEVAESSRPAGSLTTAGAIQVGFCNALGAGIALVAYYPSQCGYVGFVGCLGVIGFTAITTQSAILKTCIKNGAKTFGELCDPLPYAMQLTSVLSATVWCLVVTSLYCAFFIEFVKDQVCPLFADQCLCRRTSQYDAYIVLASVGPLYAIMFPSSFAGPVAKAINGLNFAVTWMVIIVAVYKGVSVYSTKVDEVKITAMRFENFVSICVLLSGAMCSCTLCPQMAQDLKETERHMASWAVPLSVVVLQGLVFLVVSFAGYFAVGDEAFSEDMKNIFRVYVLSSEGSDGFDWIPLFLQGGIALLMYLSCPLVVMPAKEQLYELLSPFLQRASVSALEAWTSLANAPLVTQLGINAVTTSIAIALPCSLGSDAFFILMEFCAGTAGIWLNMLLPAFILIYVDLIPSWTGAHGRLNYGVALSVAWTIIVALFSIQSSLSTIVVAIHSSGNKSSSEVVACDAAIASPLAFEQ